MSSREELVPRYPSSWDKELLMVFGQVLTYAIIATVVLASMLGSAMSTFGIEICNGSGTFLLHDKKG